MTSTSKLGLIRNPIFLVVVLFASFFINSIFANEYSAMEEDTRNFTVGVENIDYYPYYSVNSKGEYYGFARDLLDMFAESQGIQFIYEARPVKKLYQEYFIEQRLDFKFPDSEDWNIYNQNKKIVYYSDPVCSFIDGLITRLENKDKNLNFFKAIEIGVLRGFVLQDFNTFKKSESTNIDALIEKLRFGKIGGVYLNEMVAFNKINAKFDMKGKYAIASNFPSTKGTYKLSTLKHENMIYKFDQFLSERENEIKSLKNKYGLNNK